MMKKINIKLILASALLMVFAGCKDSDFDSYKIQSVDSHGNGGFVISTAATAAGSSEFHANAVDAVATEGEYQMIPVVLNAADVASQDIHVTMVPDPESLATFNAATFDEVDDVTGDITPRPDLYYVQGGSTGTPAFTLVDNGVVTIPKGSSVGYMKIKTTPADYFGKQVAYSYKISSVQEPGFIISGNHYFAVIAFIAKNPWDGVYSMGGSMGRYSAGGVPNNDGLDGPMKEGLTTDVITNGLTTNIFQMAWANGGGVGGVGATATPQITINPDNTIFLTIVDGGATPANWGPIPGLPNNYDPATKTFNINWKWGGSAPSPSGTTRAMYYKLKYKEPR